MVCQLMPMLLRSMRLPTSWLGLLFRARMFGLLLLRSTGLVVQTDRRTVVGLLVGEGMAAVVSFHSACRFFSTQWWTLTGSARP